MLHIKQIAGYSIPKYPQGVYNEYPDFISRATPRGALAAAVMAFMLEACDGGGTTGPPPLPPDMVTESEARAIIDQVFSSNGINLTHDVDLAIELSPGDTTITNVDGFNDSLQTGYEYVTLPDYDRLASEVAHALDSLIDEPNGPFVKTFYPTPAEQAALLEAVAQEFIDTLRANGSI